MKRMKLVPILFILLVLSESICALTIKIGCIAPDNSPWGRALKRIAATCKKASGGRIVFKPYMSGVAGSEADMIRKIRIGQLQAAAVTIMGLKEIYRDVLALNSPFLINDGEELDYVLRKMQPRFEEEFEKKGFKILTLLSVGWVCLFSRQPVIYPSDLRAQKLAMNADDPSIVRAWRAIGFKVLPISVTDLTIGLQTGMVDAFYTTPVAAAVFQWFATASQMCSFRISPLFGGILVDERIWKRIPDRIKLPMMKSVEEARRALCDEMSALESQALRIMKNHGLIIHQIPKEAEQQWRSIMKRGIEKAVDSSFSREVYDRVCDLLSEFRTQSKGF